MKVISTITSWNVCMGCHFHIANGWLILGSLAMPFQIQRLYNLKSRNIQCYGNLQRCNICTNSVQIVQLVKKMLVRNACRQALCLSDFRFSLHLVWRWLSGKLVHVVWWWVHPVSTSETWPIFTRLHGAKS